MRNFLLATLAAIATFAVSTAWAQTAADLMAAGMPVEQAKQLRTSNGSVDLGDSGATLILEDGTAASTCVGSVTCAGETTVSTTCVETGDYVFVVRTSTDAQFGETYVDNIVDGTSFDITCAASDTATYNWLIIKGQ